MRDAALEGVGTPRLWAPVAVVVGGLAVVAVTLASDLPAVEFASIVALGLVLGLAHRTLLGWRALLIAVILVILFIPIRRFTIPVDLPFEFEPYRALVALVVVGWLLSVLVDDRVTLRRSGFEVPIILIAAAVLGSLAFNPGRVNSVSSDVIKDATFLASFLLLFYLIVSVVRDRRTIDLLLKVLVLGSAVVAVLALYESWTGRNLFDEIVGGLPFLETAQLSEEESRGGRLRVFGSAQHPIALGAALVVALPLAVYLARRTGRRLWWVPAGLITLGAFATVSRTSVVMLFVAGVVFLLLRPGESRRFLIPALVVLPVLVHLALPGTLGTLKKSFLPEGGLIADQQRGEGGRGAGRVADLSPALNELSRNPLVGQGYGTRITDRERANADILDNQWLKTLLEIGVLGFVGWFWFIVAVIRRLGRAAKEDQSAEGWLYVALAASVSAYAVGMITYDAFSFIQVTFLLFIVLALSACALLAAPARPAGERARPATPYRSDP